MDGQELIEIHVINLIEKVAGVDRLEKQHSSLGLQPIKKIPNTRTLNLEEPIARNETPIN